MKDTSSRGDSLMPEGHGARGGGSRGKPGGTVRGGNTFGGRGSSSRWSDLGGTVGSGKHKVCRRGRIMDAMVSCEHAVGCTRMGSGVRERAQSECHPGLLSGCTDDGARSKPAFFGGSNVERSHGVYLGDTARLGYLCEDTG